MTAGQGYIYIGHCTRIVRGAGGVAGLGDTKFGLTRQATPEKRPEAQGLAPYVLAPASDPEYAEERLRAYFIDDPRCGRSCRSEWTRGLIPLPRMLDALRFAGATELDVVKALHAHIRSELARGDDLVWRLRWHCRKLEREVEAEHGRRQAIARIDNSLAALSGVISPERLAEARRVADHFLEEDARPSDLPGGLSLATKLDLHVFTPLWREVGIGVVDGRLAVSA